MSQIGTVRAELLDCVAVNLAVLADRWHGAGTHLRLGARLELRWRTGADGLPTVEPTLRDQLATATRRLGVTTATGRPGAGPAPEAGAEEGALRRVDGAGLLATVAAGGAHYVVADAWHLPWVPYHGQRHLEHSFLVEPAGADVTVIDAYHNDTPWGAARPGEWTLSPAELAAAVPDGALLARPVPGELPPAPAPEHLDGADVAGYLAPYRACADRVAALEGLTLQTWLLVRQRRLHAAYRAAYTGAAAGDAETAHLRRWDRVVEQTYLAARRVQRGRPEPPGLLAELAALLAADHTVFGTGTGRPAAPAGTGAAARPRSRSEVVDAVADVVRSVLRLPEVTATTDLGALPAFSSFRLVEIVDRLEQRFRVEFRPDDLVPERLHRVEDLCEIVLRARPCRDAVAPTTNGGFHAL